MMARVDAGERRRDGNAGVAGVMMVVVVRVMMMRVVAMPGAIATVMSESGRCGGKAHEREGGGAGKDRPQGLRHTNFLQLLIDRGTLSARSALRNPKVDLGARG